VPYFGLDNNLILMVPNNLEKRAVIPSLWWHAMETHNTSHGGSFIDILNKYRDPGESNTKFGHRMGLNHKIFRDWEKGQVPKVDTLIKLREFLELSKDEYDELFYSVYKFIPQEITLSKNTGKQEETHKKKYARNLPPNYFLKRLVALKENQETESEFARRIGLTDEVWFQGMSSPEIPKSLTTRRLLEILRILDPTGRKKIVDLLSPPDHKR
jgi:hypothetical protein